MIKFKTCEVMQYFEYYDVVEIAVIEQRIKTLTNIKKYAIIIHDKDLLDNGEPKKKHFHCILTFSNSTTSEIVAKTLKVEEQYVNKIRTTTKSAMLYLVHRNNPEKYQYSPEQVVANFDYLEYIDGCEPKQQREQIAKRIELGEIKQYNLHDFISIDEYGKNKVYYDRCFEYRQNKLKGTERNMECIFISGASGTGKTTQAKLFATQKGYRVYISSGGKNPLDNYKGEECIILDDLRDSTYKMSDFLKLTDNNTDSLVGCRFYNKSIAECRLLIVTSVKPIEEFYYNATIEEKEPQQQLFRRFRTNIIMEELSMTIYNYDIEKRQYIKQLKCKNPVALMFNHKLQKQVAYDFAKTFGLEIEEDYNPEQLKLFIEEPTEQEPKKKRTQKQN